MTFFVAHLPYALTEHHQESLSHNQYFRKDLSHCVVNSEFMTLHAAAHLRTPVMFKGRSSEGLTVCSIACLLSTSCGDNGGHLSFSMVHAHIKHDLVGPESELPSWELPASPGPFKGHWKASCLSKEAFFPPLFLEGNQLRMP